MYLLHWKRSNVYLGSLISYLVAFQILIGGCLAQTGDGESLYLTNYPTQAQYGIQYTITWQTGDYVTPVELALVRGPAPNVYPVATIGAVSGTYCDWIPSDSLANADDYYLMISQDGNVAYSLPISIAKSFSASSAALSSSVATSTTSSSPTSSTPTSTPPPASAVSPAADGSASSSVKIVNPTPTSSFNSPVTADKSLTINDKVALAIGIPIALLVLSTLGYWRAVKFFFHRKVTGEAKLPMYDGGKGNVPAIVVGSGLRRDSGRNSTWSRAPSLWGSSSRRASAMNPETQPFGGSDTELLTKPPQTVGSPRLRPDSQASARSPSALRQEWTPV